ncbi:unnamed protein product [Pleuronectes platessa]|uniref:Uncharacterized protein n=1 Tax=Pleuronectes platessa TaxID=8262 RepID=A0A9N7Z6Y7_PLEPL|nr:unnamed protein product [Pleuronectes platessa]
MLVQTAKPQLHAKTWQQRLALIQFWFDQSLLGVVVWSLPPGGAPHWALSPLSVGTGTGIKIYPAQGREGLEQLSNSLQRCHRVCRDDTVPPDRQGAGARRIDAVLVSRGQLCGYSRQTGRRTA